MKPFRTPSLSFCYMMAFVVESGEGEGELVALRVFSFSRILAFKKWAWPPASMSAISKTALPLFFGLRVFRNTA